MPRPLSFRRHLPQFAALALAGCQTLTPPPDSQVASLAQSIETTSADLFAPLTVANAPECDFAHNAAHYDALVQLADQLRNRLDARPGSDPLRLAADSLARTIADARASHERASAKATDASGPCLAPGAIALNADAIQRAAAAIADSQTQPGDR